MLTFLIPVRHPSTVKDWEGLKQVISQTLRSIAGQDSDAWQCYIAIDSEADLPDVPADAAHHFHFVPTTIPPTFLPSAEGESRAEFHDAIRRDKGARLRAALLAAEPKGHVMVVDCDDLVSNRLASLAAADPDASGWYFDEGVVWGGGNWALRYPNNFHLFCGTSHILNSWHLAPIIEGGPKADDLTKWFLGSHIRAQKELALSERPLLRLPFSGAVYRVEHGNQSAPQSLGRTLLRQRNPRAVVRRIAALRPVSARFRREFMGRG